MEGLRSLLPDFQNLNVSGAAEKTRSLVSSNMHLLHRFQSFTHTSISDNVYRVLSFPSCMSKEISGNNHIFFDKIHQHLVSCKNMVDQLLGSMFDKSNKSSLNFGDAFLLKLQQVVQNLGFLAEWMLYRGLPVIFVLLFLYFFWQLFCYIFSLIVSCLIQTCRFFCSCLIYGCRLLYPIFYYVNNGLWTVMKCLGVPVMKAPGAGGLLISRFIFNTFRGTYFTLLHFAQRLFR